MYRIEIEHKDVKLILKSETVEKVTPEVLTEIIEQLINGVDFMQDALKPEIKLIK